ncbi:uncharacterized protein MELLADRAFT_109203 [Melampsora larici-populina 98AG31]|uniref:SAP domain-containing protein n=1 Tax=Melampsora larici-populina (strain 98AG31 / pathotype 3-4-7) TaxID=747676 RepID=F4RVQ3_MELLP|nr:uncharacterized protein MELLADRAFT_109203 [Melampsora larici-populina 98AG31]EGG03399.1 hypothetical protein MELLADRAFT_109203 [Melampsora larici-populina 98AG31]
MTNQPTSSSQLTENKQSDEDTTINLPTSLLTETSLREICKTLRLDQTGSRVACLDRIKSKLKESNGHVMFMNGCQIRPQQIIFHALVEKGSKNKVTWLNFLGGDMRIIALAYQDIIPRHAQYVKKIWWRISFSEMCSYEDKMCKDIQEEDWQSTWDPIRRSQLLLDILLACPRITNLDIDIDMPEDLSPINLEILCQGREIEMNFNSEYDYDYDEEMWRQQEEEELNETD